MFYFDDEMKSFENKYEWDNVLRLLENLFQKKPTIDILVSLIGFSWYYLVEGPFYERTLGIAESDMALDYWKRYIDIGIKNFLDSQEICYISGYTLSLHGFYIDAKFNTSYEKLGLELMHKAAILNDNADIKYLAQLFLDNINKKTKCTPIDVSNNKRIAQKLFSNNSLIERYFYNNLT